MNPINYDEIYGLVNDLNQLAAWQDMLNLKSWGQFC